MILAAANGPVAHRPVCYWNTGVYERDQLLMTGSFRLAHDRQCPAKNNDPKTPFLQNSGLFFPCIVAAEGMGADTGDIIFIRDGKPAQRPYGPQATIAIRRAAGVDTEILSWEFGSFTYRQKKAGDKFTIDEFLLGLTGIKVVDRFAPAMAVTFEEAIALTYSAYERFPELLDKEAFEYLENVHNYRHGLNVREDSLSMTS